VSVSGPNAARLDWHAAGTLAGLAAARIAATPDKVAYLQHHAGRWQRIAWREVGARAGRFQAALGAAGLPPGARVAVMLENGLDWVCMDLAAAALGLVVVPLYARDRAESAAWVLGHSGAQVLLTTATHWDALRGEAALAHLARVVLVDGDGSGAPRAVSLANWLPAAGAFAVQMHDGTAPAAIVYTSGTTGRPKGVVLSHRAVLWNAAAATARVPLGPDDRLLSFLPLSHTLERTAGYYAPMLCGAEVAFARGISELPEDLRAVRPTTLVAVPRIFERVERALAHTRARWPGVLARAHMALLAAAADAYEARQRRGRYPRGWWALAPLARIAGAPVRRQLGGRLREAICGGAPLALSTARLFAGLGVPILQGYGMTEAAPVLTVNPPHDNRLGTVGPPLDDVTLHLGEGGELLARSPGLMDGYWGDAAATAQAIDAEGFLHTGDLAEEEDGYWRITGRLKDILVLANGEKVSPADLEQALTADPLIAQALVVGEGRPFLAAVLVLGSPGWAALARAIGLDPDDPAALGDAGAKRAVLRRAEQALAAFPGYARVREVHLAGEPWTVENGLLTATLKPRRAEILRRHADAVAALYAGH
jgi:long-chain acyl-CoA synthetase